MLSYFKDTVKVQEICVWQVPPDEINYLILKGLRRIKWHSPASEHWNVTTEMLPNPVIMLYTNEWFYILCTTKIIKIPE